MYRILLTTGFAKRKGGSDGGLAQGERSPAINVNSFEARPPHENAQLCCAPAGHAREGSEISLSRIFVLVLLSNLSL